MPSQLHDIYQTNPAFKKEFVSAFYVSTLSTNEKSAHRAAAGRKWKNINPDKVSGHSSLIQLIYNTHGFYTYKNASIDFIIQNQNLS